MNIQCDHLIEARRPDIVVVSKGERKCSIIDIAVPGDSRTSDNEKEKVEKYQDLKREIKRIWNVRSVIVVPVIFGALASITKKLDDWLEKTGYYSEYSTLTEYDIIRNSQDIE